MTILSFDIESNGLHGEAFAVGAVLMRSDGTIHDEFVGRCPVVGELDPWVRDNVLPPMTGIPETQGDGRSLRDAFWHWYTTSKPHADIVLANNPYPVEARFLIACQEDLPAKRQLEHPFPLIDLASLLLGVGVRTRDEREKFAREAIAKASADAADLSHNPRWDAWATAVTAHAALALATPAASTTS
jgi:hypothetical protein